jgi:hypothetical protein
LRRSGEFKVFYFCLHSEEIVRKDMDVNEHKGLPNFTLKTQIKIKQHRLYCCSAFDEH